MKRAGIVVAVLVTVLVAVLVAVLLATPAVAGAANRAKVRRPGPLRVLLVGDSVTASYQDEATALLSARGYQVYGRGVSGTGLGDVGVCKGELAKSLVAEVDPDVVVVEYVGNNTSPCKPVVRPTAKFFKLWERAAKVSQRRFTRRGASLRWIMFPPHIRASHAATTPKINAIFRKLGPVIETWSVFTPAMHTADGMHLSQAGQDRFAQIVNAAIG